MTTRMKISGILSALILVFTVLLSGTAEAAPAAIFTSQVTGQRDFVDPIAFPGLRSAHEHCFYGAENVSPVETSDDLRSKPSTWVEPGNHTGIWIPCVYENGILLQPFSTKHLLAYYKSVPC